MCDLFSGHVVNQKGKNWGKVLVVTGIHHEKDREHPSVKKIGENLSVWQTIKKADVNSGVEIVHSCGKKISKEEESALIEIVNSWIKKQGNIYFFEKVFESETNIDLRGCTIPEGLKLPGSVGGSLDLSGGTIPEGLKLPESVGGSLDLRRCTIPEGLKLPESVGGSLDLRGCTIPEGLKLPESVGEWLDLRGCTIPEGLKLPGSVGGSLDLSGGTIPEGF
jgi:hypothetical protein